MVLDNGPDGGRSVNEHDVSVPSETLIIAEAGVNHNGSLKLARQLVAVAASSGADVVKFQTFVTEMGMVSTAPKADYQRKAYCSSKSQFDVCKTLELNRDMHLELIACCSEQGIDFLSTPFDHKSIDLLVELGLNRFKIPSGEITNLPYLRHIGSYGKPTIISTGMSTLEEISIALGLLEDAGTPRDRITVLQCNTEYPTPIEDANLNAMITIRDSLGVRVGYSDHTLGTYVPIGAVAMGATIIEKHFTLDRTLPGPDHCASLEPDELHAMVQAIRNLERSLGDGIKQPTPSETKNITIVRKSIVAACDIKKGELLTEDNLAVKRPGTGISPMRWDEIVGHPAAKDYDYDELIIDQGK